MKSVFEIGYTCLAGLSMSKWQLVHEGDDESFMIIHIYPSRCVITYLMTNHLLCPLPRVHFVRYRQLPLHFAEELVQ